MIRDSNGERWWREIATMASQEGLPLPVAEQRAYANWARDDGFAAWQEGVQQAVTHGWGVAAPALGPLPLRSQERLDRERRHVRQTGKLSLEEDD